MTNLAFSNVDSWAIWSVPTESLAGKTAKEREQAFGAAYQPETFPAADLPSDLGAALQASKFVLVGMNPGNGAVDHPADVDFLNFHGQKKSLDYRLAAAAYDTPAWGAFMTDLSGTIESDSTKVQITAADVVDLESHLDELGVPSDATLIAMGGKTAAPLTKFAKRPVAQIQHYSGANGHWNAEDVHNKLVEITK